jgi:hexosaminidase
MKLWIALAFLFTCETAFTQSTRNVAIIPEPVSLKTTSGQFLLPQNIVIETTSEQQLKQPIQVLQDRLSKAAGRKVTVANNSPNASIKLELNKTPDNSIGNEGYKLSVTPKNIVIKANKPAGLFYGVQTLLQLLPKEIESATLVNNVQWTVPAVEITDYPRFGWRGLMFDVSRHFFTKKEVMQFIDDMVRYKYNLLHMHLTDDEGWRIEIKSLPKLTEVGAWNVKKVGYFGTFSTPTPDEPRNYGGFYTQEDIKEIVAYAKERFVDILPEVDVPGHSLAAIAAYPELACSAGTGEPPAVSSGQSIKDWSKHEALVDDNLCPSNEKVYQFLDKVITELAQLFPFEYIHMGGDETFKTFWEKATK